MKPDQAIYYHFITVTSLVVFKLAVLLVGYLIARLGHDLLIKGVSGQFKFSTQFQGGSADLVSASPGIFFILMATILIAVGVIKDKPFETKVTTEYLRSGAEQTATPAAPTAKPILSPPPISTKDSTP